MVRETETIKKWRLQKPQSTSQSANNFQALVIMIAKLRPFLKELKHKQAGVVVARRRAFTHIILQSSKNKTIFHPVESPNTDNPTISLRTILVIGKVRTLSMPVLTISEVYRPIYKMVITTLKKS